IFVGILIYSFRTRLTNAVDRYFFREHYDSHRILVNLVDSIRSAEDVIELFNVLTREIDRALHLARISVLTLDPETGFLKALDDSTQPLNAASKILDILEHSGRAVDLSHPLLLTDLGDNDKLWLRECGFKLLVPIQRANGVVIGLICLGQKKS